MVAVGDVRCFEVILTMTAPALTATDPDGTAPPAAAQAVLLLDPAGESCPWTAVTATGTAGGLQLHLTCRGTEVAGVAAAVVDGVRALAGLSATFARWVVEARQVEVHELPQ